MLPLDGHAPLSSFMSTFTNRWVQGLTLLAACLIVMTMALLYWTINRKISIEKEEMRQHFQYIVGDINAMQDALLWATDIEEFSGLQQMEYPMKLERYRHETNPGFEAYVVTHPITGLSYQLAFRSLNSEEANRKEAVAISALSDLILLRFLSRLSKFEAGRLPINLLDLQDGKRVAFGCDLPLAGGAVIAGYACIYNDEQLFKIIRSRRKNENRAVFWKELRRSDGHNGLVAFAKVNEPISFVHGDWWVSASWSFQNVPQFPHIVGGHGHSPTFFEVYSPEGELLTARIQPPQALIAGIEFLRDSSIVQFASKEGWAIKYKLSYINIFRELYPQLAMFGLLLMGCIVVACLVLRWYFKRHYLPAVEQRRRTIESEEFARGVIDVAQVAMCVVDCRTSKPLKVNTLAREWLGSDEELYRLARSWVASYGAKGSGTAIVSLSIRNRHFSGCFALARYEDHDVLLCTLSDISAHVRAQESLEWAKRVADQSSAAKSAFLATMSHEIRTPLYGVLGTLELLSETHLSGEQRSYLDTTLRSAGILLHIIGDVLDMSKIESGTIELNEAEFSPVDLTEIVAQAYTATASNKGLSLHCVVTPEVPRAVLGDAGRVRQVLNNLLSNAIKFTEIGRTRISLDAEPGTEGHKILTWRVSDTGIGISMQDQIRLFEPFFQVRSEPGAAGGTGLGLAICKSLIDLMGGTLDVASKVGDGSTFSVSIEVPVVDGDIAVAPACDLPNMAVVVRAPTVELRRHYRQWLERWGVQCDSEVFEPTTQDRVLLNVSPDLMTPLQWPGRQIVATERGPLQPQRQSGVVCVSSHSLAALAQALAMAANRSDAGGDSPDSAISDGYPPQMREAPSLPVHQPRALGLRVLLAEDSAINQEVLRRQLKALGCSVVVRGDGVGALKAWDDNKFDVLLTDVNMPGIGGPELINRLRHGGMQKPIICVTANAQQHLGRAAEYSAVDAWLVKPITLRTLQDCLQRTVANRLPNGSRSLPTEPMDDSGHEGLDDDIPSFMHGIFQAAMEVDGAIVRRCLEEGDHAGLKVAIHRVRGGLVMAGQENFAQDWLEAEERLETGMPLDEDDVKHVFAIVSALEMLLSRLRLKEA